MRWRLWDQGEQVAATLTAHHLRYNRNHMLVGGILSAFYCLPCTQTQHPSASATGHRRQRATPASSWALTAHPTPSVAKNRPVAVLVAIRP